MTSIFEGKPPKTWPFPTKTRVIWVPGIYIYNIHHLEVLFWVKNAKSSTMKALPFLWPAWPWDWDILNSISREVQPRCLYIIVGLRDYHFLRKGLSSSKRNHHFFEIVVSPSRAIELVFSQEKGSTILEENGGWCPGNFIISPMSRLSYLQKRLQPTSCRGSWGTWWNVASAGWMMCWSRIQPCGSVELLSKEGGSGY